MDDPRSAMSELQRGCCESFTQTGRAHFHEGMTGQPDDRQHTQRCRVARSPRTMECPMKLMRWRLRNVACRPCTSVTSRSPHLLTRQPRVSSDSVANHDRHVQSTPVGCCSCAS